jgi:hypothetical protein
MAIYNYTLPSGSKYQLNAPNGTTQVEADNIFYSQVAAGTFVGYTKGDTLRHPTEVLSNFGLSRLQRGTAGVDDKTLMAVVANLPIVVELPTLTSVPVSNPISQASYILVTSTPVGRTNITLQAGQLTSQETQSLMAQLSAIAKNDVNTFTQADGIGIYGFNCNQLEQAGLIKPGMSALYCPLDKTTGDNPSNFVAFMSSPTPWTGFLGVTSVFDILGDAAIQNQIEEILLDRSYNQLVASGVIIPPKPRVTTPPVSTGRVYTNGGTLASASSLTLLTSTPSLTNGALDSSLTPVGTVPLEIQNLGAESSAIYSYGLSSLATGAVGFTTSPGQLSGLSTGLAAGTAAGVSALIGSRISGDVGALMAIGSKYGVSLASSWAAGSASGFISTASSLGALVGSLIPIPPALAKVSAQINTAVNTIAKAAQFAASFSNFSLSGLISGVQPAAGFNNTVNRSTLDAALNRVIGSALISPPMYEIPSIKSLGILADIGSAKQILSQAQAVTQNIGNRIVNIR